MNQLQHPALLRQSNYIGGQWFSDLSTSIDVRNPADGQLIGRVPSVSVAEVHRAIAEAKKAFGTWKNTTAKERQALLLRWHGLILQHADDLARILTAEHGKPLAEAKTEILSNAAYIEWFAEQAKRITGDIIPSTDPHRRLLVVHQPVGVCVAITPWNFPMGMMARKVGPALAAGCTMVVKPASKTPFSALALAYLAEQAGLPPGVLSVITGAAHTLGSELCHHPDIAKITFTGSTEVGRWLMRESSGTLKRLSMELGGNAPFIVFADADLDAAVEGLMASKFRNSGQTCVCANRIYVERAIAEPFVQRLAEKIRALKVGPGDQADTTQGPLIDQAAVKKVEEHIADAVAQGATLVVGGKRHSLGGSYFEPTLLTNVRPTMRVCHEETFGPLAPVVVFDSEQEVLDLANDSEYGLAGYCYTRDLGRAWRVAERMESGMCGINTGLIANEMAPFGGIKQSGFGREGSEHGIKDYLNIKYIAMAGL